MKNTKRRNILLNKAKLNRLSRYLDIKKETIILLLILLTSFFISFAVTKNIALSHEDARNIFIVKAFNERHELIPFSPYQGVNFFLIPFVALFGYNPISLRIADSFFLSLAILFMFLFVRIYYNKKVALLSSFLIMFITFFITNTESEVPFLPFCSLLFLYLFFSFYKSQKKSYLYMAFFFAGWAIFLKITFLYFFLACLLSFFIVFRKDYKILNCLDIKTISFLVILFLAGLSPFIYYNLTNNFPFFRLIFSNLASTQIEHSNANILSNLFVRLNHVSNIISPGSWTFQLKACSFNTFLLISSIIYFLFFKPLKKHSLIISLIIFYLIFSTFSVSNIIATHLMLISPLFVILMAYCLIDIYKIKKAGKIIAVSLLCFFVLSNIAGYIQIYKTSIDKSFFEINYPKNAEVHQLSALYFKDKPYKIILGVFNPTYFFDALVSSAYPIEILCKHSAEGFWSYPYPSADCINAKKIIDENLNDSNVRWVFASLPRINKSYSNIYFDFCAIEDLEKNFCHKPFYIFKDEVLRNNMTLALECTINDSKGNPVYDIYKILPINKDWGLGNEIR